MTAQTLYLHLKIGNVKDTGALCTNNNPTANTAWVNCVTLPKATTFSKIIIFFFCGAWTQFWVMNSPYGAS